MINTIRSQKKLSFLLGGKPFESLEPTVTVMEEFNTVTTVYDFVGGLRLTNVFKAYPEHNACDWVNMWENKGAEPTEMISELWDGAVSLPFSPCEPKTTGRAYLPASENVIKVYVPRGSDWSDGEFFCDVDRHAGNRYDNWLERYGDTRKYATVGGRSAQSTYAPFFNIRHGARDEGYIVAIGWTGQWNATVTRNEEGVFFQSKLEDTAFRLLPGERFRTSSVTVLGYSGSFADGQNSWRRLIKDIYSPVGKGEVSAELPFCAGLWGGMSTAGCLERIEKVENAKLPFNCYWMDAGWYGAGEKESPDEFEGDWAQHTGNWEVNSFRHPDGLMDVANAINKTDKGYLLWVEPARVRRETPIVAEHPEYFIFPEDERNPDLLLNLGDERAWQYCFDTLSELIERLNLAIYRQDFNFTPLEYWRKNDTEGRRGISEIKHIEGLYRLWDALRARFPSLLIDNCASGGRRIDIETLRRSVPLWRSDAQCPADPEPDITQAHCLSHGSWMPYSGTGVGRIWFDTYRFRSAYSPALTTNFTFSERNSFGDDPEGMSWLNEMCAEYIKVRPYLTKDIYPLTKPSAVSDIWSAVQYHDPETDSGILLVFRRKDAPYTECSFPLFGLCADKTYGFTALNGEKSELSGDSLMNDGFKVRMEKRRDSRVYFYKSEH